MKKLAASALALLLICLALPLAASAAGETVEVNKDYGGDWRIDGSTYTCRERINWPDFGVYTLGNADGIIKLYMEMTVADKSVEPDGLGGDAGFLVGITDVDGDGIIEENGDLYYLIDISSSNDGGFVAIEKNIGKWNDWSVIDHSSSFQRDSVVGLCLIYDPAAAHFAVYITEIDDMGNKMTEADPWIEWTDENDPLTGKGFGICSKITGGVFNNVTVATGTEATPPEPTPYEPGYDVNAGSILLADFTDPETIKRAIGTGHDCELEHDEENGCLKVTVTGQDPFFKVPMDQRTYFDGGKYTVLEISMKTAEYTQAEVFFTSRTSRDIARNHIFFDIEDTEGEFTTIDVDMSYDDHETWGDQIRSIRIDPDHNGIEDEVFYIRSVYIKTEEAAYETVEDTAAAGTEAEETTGTVTDTEVVTEQTETKPETTTAAAPTTTDAAAEKTEPGKSGNPVVIIVIIAAVAAVAAVCAVIVIKKTRRKKA